MQDLSLCCCAALTHSQYFRIIFHTDSLLCPLPKDKDAKELNLNSTRCWHNFFPTVLKIMFSLRLFFVCLHLHI